MALVNRVDDRAGEALHFSGQSRDKPLAATAPLKVVPASHEQKSLIRGFMNKISKLATALR
jgi:hypothetical protein